MAANSAFSSATSDLRGLPIGDLFAQEDKELASAVVSKFFSVRPPGGIEQRSLKMIEHGSTKSFDVLTMQQIKNDRRELLWVVKDGQTVQLDPKQIQETFLNEVKTDVGLMITDPFGSIQSVNEAFCRISEYHVHELVAQNPRMMSSGRHDTAFYQNFWINLLDQGHWSGEVFNRRKSGQIFLAWETIKMVENEKGEVLSYIAATMDLSQRDASNIELRQFAYHDPLTGLPNRRLLQEKSMLEMENAAHEATAFSLLFVDLDKFKPINDALGHHVGDEVLKEVAERLKESVRKGDTVARVGGDEFVLLLPSARRVQDVESIVESLLSKLEEPIRAGHHSLKISASIGCARYPDDGEDMGALISKADAAMYAAKRFGTQFAFYDTGTNGAFLPNIGFELWEAVERNEFDLLYQPQINEEDGSYRGCEALLRWTHPVMGSVEPAIFIPIAEKNGAILKIGRWVLDGACKQIAQWKTQGLESLIVTVNVSLRQIRDPEFADCLKECLSEHAVDPRLLELDLSETDVVQYQMEDVVPINAIRSMGVRVAIDDFGIAFHSLSKLRGLSISCLKISTEVIHSLTDSEEARAISRCLVAVSRALDIELVAAGVETSEQLGVLIDHGCNLIQGYLTGMPMTAAEISDLLRKLPPALEAAQ